MASIIEIQELFKKWEVLPSLTPVEESLVRSMREVSDKGSMQEFVIFKDSLCVHFWREIYSAIKKARDAQIN